jgi:GNAT superfamily N-acetyltransferase
MWREIGRWSEADLDRADQAYRRWVRREQRAKRFFAYVVETPSGEPAGSGAVWLAPNQPRPGRLASPELPYILSMYTEPRFRRRGVATLLVRTMVTWAAHRGYRRVVLHASRQGRPVYARLGFEATREMRLDLPARRR